MHELGIIVHISRTLDEVAKENNLTEIGSVTLEIGEVSGIVPDYMTDCWKYYRKKSELFKESDLKIEILPAVTYREAVRRPILRWNSDGSAPAAAVLKPICSRGMSAASKKSRPAEKAGLKGVRA